MHVGTVVIDTDVVSFLHKKDSRARLFRPHLVGNDRIISFMTLAELGTGRGTRWFFLPSCGKLTSFSGRMSTTEGEPPCPQQSKSKPVSTARPFACCWSVAVHFKRDTSEY
jgi:hypothetical protein